MPNTYPQPNQSSDLTSYMLDSNIFDRLIDGDIELSDIGQGVFLATRIQLGEISNTPCEDRRVRLLMRFIEVVETVVPGVGFRLDELWMGLDQSEWDDGSGLAGWIEARVRELDKQQRKARKADHPNPRRDSIIAATAAKHGALLVTSDASLAQAFRESGHQALHYPRPRQTLGESVRG